LVPLIEEGWLKKPATRLIIKKYLLPLKRKNINFLILACTHYEFLSKEIKRIAGKNVKIINSSEAVADKLIDYLHRHPEINQKLDQNKKRNFYITNNDLDNFIKFSERNLHFRIKSIKNINLE